MRKSKFSESQIAGILKEAEAGMGVADVARKHGISAATFYAWRSKYGGMSVSDLQRLPGRTRRSGYTWATPKARQGGRKATERDPA